MSLLTDPKNGSRTDAWLFEMICKGKKEPSNQKGVPIFGDNAMYLKCFCRALKS